MTEAKLNHRRIEIGETTKTGALTVTGTLKHGLRLGERKLTKFVMREATMADMFAAEDHAAVDATPLKYRGALMAIQLVRIDDYEGPFTLSLIETLKQGDYMILRNAQGELDRLGEAE